MGAFDTLYHHEFTERLPWRTSASKELAIHGVRNFIYVLVFLTLAWLEWHGVWTWVFILLLLAEVGITLWDFVVEDRTRKLPATERVTHTLLAINYGVILALLFPQLWLWSQQSTGFSTVNYGWASWVMTLFAGGVWLWALRDSLRAKRLAKLSTKGSAAEYAALFRAAPQRVLLTGGTGLIGTALSQALVDAGHEVTVWCRDSVKASTLIRGRLTLINALTLGQGSYDVVINLAGAPIAVPWNAKNRARIWQSRIQTTQQLVDYIAQSSHKPHTFLSGSAIGYYGNSESAVFDETSTPVDQGFSTQLCQEWERLACEATRSGVRVCLLRTGLVLSTEGGLLGQLLFPYEFGLGGKIGSGRQMLSWIHMRDYLAILALCLQDKSLHGPINMVAPHPVPQAEFGRTLAKTLKRPYLLATPAFVLRWALGPMAEELLLNGQNVVPKRVLEQGFAFQYPQLGAAMDQLLGN